MVTIQNESLDSTTWYLDSGATCHISPRKEWLTSYKTLNPPLVIYIGDDGQTQSYGSGTAQINLKNGEVTHIHEVLHVPDLAKNCNKLQ